MKEPLAHSAHDGAPEQTYQNHVSAVAQLALDFGEAAAAFSPRRQTDFLDLLRLAASYHDLGKLDPIFQEDLRCNRRRTRLNHVDAGTAHLLAGKHGEAAVAIYSHHLGLPSFPAERAKNANGVVGMFRDLEQTAAGTGLTTAQRSNAELANYLSEHHSMFPRLDLPSHRLPRRCGLVRRLLLSCLVDADHTDTARHYGNEPAVAPPRLAATERLQALDRYVDRLAAEALRTGDRERLRQDLRAAVYRACRETATGAGPRIFACDSPVGTGKTTAVLAHALATAAQRRLRRIFVVLPFTAIIDQSVAVYRKALRLPSETEGAMQAVVAAHHHRVEYSGEQIEPGATASAARLVESALMFRCLAQRWDAPIIVTTAVQFFETLASRSTAALRKLHQLPGSAIFIDEAHAAMPPALWRRNLAWLRELCDDWGCHLVLASGTLARFWSLPELRPDSNAPEIPELLPREVADAAQSLETGRVRILTLPGRTSLPQLADFVLHKPGPQLVILNTVQSAAVVARYLRDLNGIEVEHLSTALTPADRANTLRLVVERLRSGTKDWCLVATSCVEAGVDFSFRTGFRESWGLMNLLQTAGRVNRTNEHESAEVWDFRHDDMQGLCPHPQARLPREVLAKILDRCTLEARQPSPGDCTEALRLEIRNDRGRQALRIEEIEAAEEAADYPEVAKLCRVIDAATKTVVVDPEIVARIEAKDRTVLPTWREIARNSVQLWASRLDPGIWPLRPIGDSGELWAWVGRYDSFLGYMAGVLHLIDAGQRGFEVL